jgi:hypothetical protein
MGDYGSMTNFNALGVPGMGINVAVLPLLLPNRQRWPKKRQRVYRGFLERRPKHCSGHDGTAGAMGLSPNKRCAGVSDTCRVGLEGWQCYMPVYDGAVGDQEGGQGATAKKGGELQEGGVIACRNYVL